MEYREACRPADLIVRHRLDQRSLVDLQNCRRIDEPVSGIPDHGPRTEDQAIGGAVWAHSLRPGNPRRVKQEVIGTKTIYPAGANHERAEHTEIWFRRRY